MCKIPEDINLEIVDGKTLDSFYQGLSYGTV